MVLAFLVIHIVATGFVTLNLFDWFLLVLPEAVLEPELDVYVVTGEGVLHESRHFFMA